VGCTAVTSAPDIEVTGSFESELRDDVFVVTLTGVNAGGEWRAEKISAEHGCVSLDTLTDRLACRVELKL
jgi:hypothetical protein